jgi:L-seryl-tRNA(Ser) seleniumtransferase
VPTGAVTGGGSLPGVELESWAVTVQQESLGATAVARLLLAHSPPVVARVEDERVVLDLRAVGEHDDSVLEAALRACLG